MPVFAIEYEAKDKMYRIVIEAKNESAALKRVEKLLYQQGLESEAEIYSIREIE